MEKREPSYTVDDNVNWYSHYGDNHMETTTMETTSVLVQPVWMLLKKLNIELPYDPAILLLGIYPKKTIIQKDACTPVFIAVLFTVSKTWKQPKCPSTGMDKEGMVHIYNGILLSHKKERNNAICSSVDGPRVYHTKCSKSDKDK